MTPHGASNQERFFAAAKRSNTDLMLFLVFCDMFSGLGVLLLSFMPREISLSALMMGAHFMMGFVGWWGLRRMGFSLKALIGFNNPPPALFLTLLPLITLYYGLSFSEITYTTYLHSIIAPILGLKDRVPFFSQLLPFLSNRYFLIALLFHLVFWGPFCEELLFRGYLQRAYGQINRFYAVLVPSILFGLLHGWEMAPLSKIFMGASLALISLQFGGTIAPSFVVHCINNALPVLFIWQALRHLPSTGLNELLGASAQAAEKSEILTLATHTGMLFFSLVTLLLAGLFLRAQWKRLGETQQEELTLREGAKILLHPTLLLVVFVSILL